FGIESKGALDEVVAGIAVEQRADSGKVLALDVERRVADQNEPLVFVGPVKEAKHQVNRLFFVLGIVDAQRINTESGGSGNVSSVFALHVELLTKGRDWRSDNLLGEVLVIDLRNVIDAEAALAHRGVNIFAAQLNAQDLRTGVLA